MFEWCLSLWKPSWASTKVLSVAIMKTVVRKRKSCSLHWSLKDWGSGLARLMSHHNYPPALQGQKSVVVIQIHSACSAQAWQTGAAQQMFVTSTILYCRPSWGKLFLYLNCLYLDLWIPLGHFGVMARGNYLYHRWFPSVYAADPMWCFLPFVLWLWVGQLIPFFVNFSLLFLFCFVQGRHIFL